MAAREVWKYSLQLNTTVLQMPAGAQLLSIAVPRQGEVVLYALVNPKAARGPQRTFVVLETGQSGPEEGTLHFLGTCTRAPGLWFHVFEVIDEHT
jgi:hypothetical protein